MRFSSLRPGKTFCTWLHSFFSRLCPFHDENIDWRQIIKYPKKFKRLNVNNGSHWNGKTAQQIQKFCHKCHADCHDKCWHSPVGPPNAIQKRCQIRNLHCEKVTREKQQNNNTGKENFEFAMSYPWMNHSKYDDTHIFVSRSLKTNFSCEGFYWKAQSWMKLCHLKLCRICRFFLNFCKYFDHLSIKLCRI